MSSPYKKIIQYWNDCNYYGCLQEINKLIEERNEDYYLLCMRAFCYEKMEFFRKGIRDCDTAIKLNPNCCHAYYYKGRILHLMGKPNQSLKVFEEGVKYEGDLHILQALNKSIEQKKPVDIVIDRPSTIKIADDSTSSIYQAQLNQYDSTQETTSSNEPIIDERLLDDELLKKYDPNLFELITKMKGMIQNATGDERIDKMIAIGYLHVNSQNFETGIKIFSELLKINPRLIASYLGRGTAYALMGKFLEAIREFSTAIEIDSNCADAYKRRGQTLAALKDFNRALKDLNKAVDLEKGHDSYYQRGLLYLNMKNFNKALDDFLISIRYDHSNIETYHNIGISYNATGRCQLAVDYYRKAIALNPNYADAYTNLGQTYKEWGKFDEAIKHFNKAIEINPAHVHAYHLKGLALHAKGRYFEALETFKRVIELDPNHLEAHWMTGTIQHGLGLMRQSVKDFEQALRISPDHYIWYQKELALFWHHHLDKELDTFNIDHELDPQFKEWWCKRNPPSTLPQNIRQPSLDPKIPDTDLNTKLTEDQKRLLKFAWEIGITMHQDAPGFILNERQIKMVGLAAIEIAQVLKRLKKGPVEVNGKQSSGNRDPHQFGWRDLYDIAVKWRQYSEPFDPVWWVDKLTKKQFTEGFGSHTPMISGQCNVVRYSPMVEKAFKIMKNLTLKQCTLSNSEKEAVEKAKDYKELYHVKNMDYWVVTPCMSICHKNKVLEGTRLTIQYVQPEGYEFSIRTPGTPPRWIDYEQELEYSFNEIVKLLRMENPPLDEVSKWILTLTFYWYNFMPLSRGTAATGYCGILALFLAFDIQITSKIPKGRLIDWDGILIPTPEGMIEKFSKWLYPGRKPLDVEFFNSLPSVSATFNTIRKISLGLALPYE